MKKISKKSYNLLIEVPKDEIENFLAYSVLHGGYIKKQIDTSSEAMNKHLSNMIAVLIGSYLELKYKKEYNIEFYAFLATSLEAGHYDIIEDMLSELMDRKEGD